MHPLLISQIPRYYPRPPSELEKECAKISLIVLYSCKNSIGKIWRLKLHKIEWVHESIVRPILAYGALVWYHSLCKSSYKPGIDKVERAASLLITSAFRSILQAALGALLCLNQLSIHLEKINVLLYVTGSWQDLRFFANK